MRPEAAPDEMDSRHAPSGATLASAPAGALTQVQSVPDPRLSRRWRGAEPVLAAAPATVPATDASAAIATAAISPFQLEDAAPPESDTALSASVPGDLRPAPLASLTSDAQTGPNCAALQPQFSQLDPSLAPTDISPTSTTRSAAPTAALAQPTGAAKPSRPQPSNSPHPLDRAPDDPSLAPQQAEFTRATLVYSCQGCELVCDAAYHSSTPKRVIDVIGVRCAALTSGCALQCCHSRTAGRGVYLQRQAAVTICARGRATAASLLLCFCLLQDSITCDLQFNCSRRLALCILHVLNRGAPPFLRLKPQSTPTALAAFESVFQRILVSERDPPLPVSCITDGAETFEILFVPIHDLSAERDGDGKWASRKQPCFWCYRVVPGAVAAGIKWLSMCRLPVVLDLDDTLVVANGEGALRDKRDKVCAPATAHACCVTRTAAAGVFATGHSMLLHTRR
jgi:hypothetical protein